MTGQTLKATAFRTRWGHFGLAADASGLVRTCLPVPDEDLALRYTVLEGEAARFERHLLPDVRERIKAYFEGRVVDFADIALSLGPHSPFAQATLAACRRIEYGRTSTYAALAAAAGSPRACRAAGSVLAHNRLPLIIPCHRVLGSSGALCGFSAHGGIDLKRRMLDMEAGSGRRKK